MSDADDVKPPSINVRENGPLLVWGGVTVRRESIVHSEHGEPMTYSSAEALETGDVSALCRCGDSANKPFCDGSHVPAGFDGTEAAPSTYADQSNDLGGTGITVHDNRSMCVHAGFCGTRVANVWKLAGETEESTTRIQVIGMVENCPSGALTYTLDGESTSNEPQLPVEIAVLDDGPLFVKGGIGITAADGTELEVRNRVTLCRCGHSANKPYCDGAHNEAGFSDS